MPSFNRCLALQVDAERTVPQQHLQQLHRMAEGEGQWDEGCTGQQTTRPNPQWPPQTPGKCKCPSLLALGLHCAPSPSSQSSNRPACEPCWCHTLLFGHASPSATTSSTHALCPKPPTLAVHNQSLPVSAQQDDLLYGTNGSTRMERNTGGAVALASRMGQQAFTGTSCPAGSKFFWWSARCTRAKTQEECPPQVGSVLCAWSSAAATCRPVRMDAFGALLDEQGTDPWVRRFREMAATCRGGTGGVDAGSLAATDAECTARGMPYVFNRTRMVEYGSLTPELYTSGTPLPPELPQLPPQQPPTAPLQPSPSPSSSRDSPTASRPPRPPTAPRGLSVRAPVAAPMPRPLGPPRPPAPPPAPPRPPDIPYAPRLTRGSENSSPSASSGRWHMGRQSAVLVSLASCLSALFLGLL